MRFFLPILALTLTLAGCGGSSTERDTPAARATVQSAPQFTWHCESGETIAASYPTDSTAVVTVGDRIIPMTIAISASGARYVGGGLEWWSKGSGPGSEGTLFRHNADGTSGDIVERCEMVANASPPDSTAE